MSNTVVSTTGSAREAMDRLASRDSLAVRSLRNRAFDEFQALPMPSPETEEWRYTDLRELELEEFSLVGEEPRVASIDDVKPELLEVAGDVGDRAGLAIQHNSTVITAHLDPGLAAKGVVFASLDDVARDQPDLLEGRLHQAVPSGRSKFTSLHAAVRTGGVLIYVPDDVRIELPLQTLTYVDRDGMAVFPHTVLVTGEGAEVTYIDRYASPDLGTALSDAVVEIYAGAGSKIRYVSLQEWGQGVTHLAVQRAHVGRDAELRSLGVAFGASLARSEVESILGEAGGSSEMLGIYFGSGTQHIDHRSIQDHYGDKTASDLLYKGVMKGHSNAIYTGTVIIEAGAHRCDAYQTNRNILLSETAKAHSVPNLEILTNDPVRCGHAASVGPVDEDTLFYIQSRGIPFEEAQKLVVFGFFQEVLDRVTLPEIRTGLEAAIAAELERGD
jgi:Fe-S cluster assembly protein SufD